MNFIRSCATVAALVVAVASTASAQQDARLTLIRDDATREVVRQQLGGALSRGVPVEPMMAKALEGVAKRASTKSIRAAMARLEENWHRAAKALAPNPTDDELGAGADALQQNVPESALRSLRKLAPGRSIALEIGVLTQLVARNVEPGQASKMVLELMARKATGTQLTALSSAVQEDVEAGLAPAMALDLRGRGIMSLLPPPSAVSTLNPRSTPRP
ncbi:MAG: hypothetical protein NTU67_12205 [Gemmatimonadetes bacterium]|nr:hypothetical protein [Gemmatimonadota bacterium]